MTENEAIEKLHAYLECESRRAKIVSCNESCDDCELCYMQGTGAEHITSVKTAIKALEEVQQYRQIGTVEECREAVEKQTAIEPEKVNIPCTSWTKAHMRYRCSCGSFLTSYDDYCNKCGQKLKWGDGK